MKEDTKIEQLFRNEFENFEIQPSKKVWRGVRSDLFIKNFFHFSLRRFNAWYAAGVIIIASVAIFSLIQPTEQILQEVIKQNPAISTTSSDSLETSGSSLSKHGTRSNSYSKTPEGETVTLNSKPSFAKASEGETHAYAKASEGKTRNKESEKLSDLSKENITNYSGRSVFAWFECPKAEGCAPLSASFRNFSQNAVRYSWSFGDGGSSELANPSYIFDEPGTWFVSLTAYSAGNEISIFIDSIKVSPMPEARFSMDMQGLPGDGHPVYFYNYSTGAESYLWDFGDGTSSILKEPDHYFNKKGQTNIKLLAFSVAGCSDSIILKDAFKAGEPVFIFPTAFSPNTNGPGTGQYTRKDPANDVFYPYVEEEPEEYRLRIFNRTGILIFESNDISNGWDGYYHEELQPQGVYVWKARAVFADGRSVVRMGDVTLLWGN